MIKMSVNNSVTSEESNDKKEVITTFDITPTDGLDILRKKAISIQECCTDTLIKNVSLQNLAMYCTDGVFRAKYVQDSEVKNHTFSDFSFGQLCSKLGIPAKYMIACAKQGYSELATDNFNTWIDDFGKDLLFRVYKDRIRGVLSSRYSVFDTPNIIDAVYDSTRGLGLKVKSFFINEERFHARLIQQDKMKINGEDLFAGIQIDSSDVGRSTLMVNFFIFKQICTNGLCVTKGKANLFTQKHISICSDDFKEELKQSLKYLPDLIGEYEHTIKRCALQYNILGNSHTSGKLKTGKMLEDFIQKLKSKTNLSEDGVNKVIDLSNNKYGFSDWGIVNSITEVAQDYTLERRIELEKIAGSMLKVV